jgi:DNA-binding CsgD family transcriptional regulator
LGEAAAQQADIPDRILALTTLALAALYDGALEEASEALRQAQGIAAPQKTRAAYQAALGVCASLLRRERGEAWSASPPADGASLLGFSPEILVESARLAAISALRDSGYGAARGHLKRAREAAVACVWRRAETALLAEELVLAARGGEHRAAASLAQEIKKLGGSEAPEVVLALATFEIEKGANAAARVRLAALLSRELPRRWRMRGLILDARAAAALAAGGDAGASLARYLALCGEGVMAATFFEDGAALWNELLDITSKLTPMGQRDRRLDAVADLAIARAHFVDGAPLAAPTDQEVGMLAALRRSGARAEAARMLKMSENTLKFYLKRVFQKWRINDWRLAVRVAERMGALGETHREREAVV